MRKNVCMALALTWLALARVPSAMSLDWDPVTEAEKAMRTNPIDPGAGSIVLFKRGNVRVNNRGSFWLTTIETYNRIKILTESGREAANVSIEANKYYRLSKIEGRTILPSGRIIPLDPDQVHRGRTYQSGNGFAIFKTSFAFPSVEPGAIVEYQIVENEDSFFPPPWIFDEPGLATLRSTLTVAVDAPLAVAQFPVETTRKKIKAHENRTATGWEAQYEVENLFPVRGEPYPVPFRDQAAMIIFTPYQYGGGVGNVPLIQKWDDVAEAVNKEFREASARSKQAKEKAREIAGKIPDERGKAEAIYRFLQGNVASTELRGVRLGGTLDERLAAKRGDPDEINALFVTMLREVKVDADLVLIAARNWQSLIGKFPNMVQFSRAITLVNLKEGAVVADPAEPAAPFGSLPWFEQGIVGLGIKGNKAQQVPIPLSPPEDNVTETKLLSELMPGWKIESHLEIAIKGASATEVRRDLLEEAPEKLRSRLTDLLGMSLPEAVVADISHPDLKETSQPILLKARVQHEITEEGGPGERLLNPWVADRYTSPLFKATERFSAVQFWYPEKKQSTSTWHLPPGVQVEQLPQEVHLNNDLGEFSHACAQQGDTITCTRSRVLKKMLLRDMDEYRIAKKFFEDIARYDQQLVVLREN